MMTGSDVTGDTFSARLRQVAPKGSETERRLSLVRSYISVQRYWLIGLAFPAVLFSPIPSAWLMMSMFVIQSTAQRSLSWARIAYTMPVTERDVAVTRWLCVVLPFPIFAFVVASVGAILGWLRLLDVPLYVCEALVWSHGICGMALVGAHVQRRTSSRGGLFTTGPSMLAPRQSRLRWMDVVLGVAAFAVAMMLFVYVHKYRTDLTALKAGALLIGLFLIVPSFLCSRSLPFRGGRERMRIQPRSFAMRLSARPGRRSIARETLRNAAFVLVVASAVKALCTFVSNGADVLVLMIPLAVTVVPLSDNRTQGGGLRVLRFLPWSRLRLALAASLNSWVIFAGFYFGLLLVVNGENRLGSFSPQFLLGVCLILIGASLLVQAASYLISPYGYFLGAAVLLSVVLGSIAASSAHSMGLDVASHPISLHAGLPLITGVGLVLVGYVCLYSAIGCSGAYARRPGAPFVDTFGC